MKIKKGDRVKILKGKDKGKAGKVLQVYFDREKVTVEGANLLHKNMRPKKQGEKGQRIQFPSPVAVANVALLCPKCSAATKVGYRLTADGKKSRVCKKCKEIIG